MNINLFFETILILFAILASNGFIFSFTIFTFNKENSPKNISVITNNSEKDGLALTLLIASNPISLTLSDSELSASETLSVTSSETNVSQTLSVTSETNVSQDIFENWIDSELSEGMMTQTQNSYLSEYNNEDLSEYNDEYISNANEVVTCTNVDTFDQFTSLDSLTVLDYQTFEEWREIAMDLYEHPVNTPIGILQQIKFEELNILYSQDIIHYAITQTELRLIIEHFPAMSLFKPDINHLILTIMSYYHL
jgi:hypothetical protein